MQGTHKTWKEKKRKRGSTYKGEDDIIAERLDGVIKGPAHWLAAANFVLDLCVKRKNVMRRKEERNVRDFRSLTDYYVSRPETHFESFTSLS